MAQHSTAQHSTAQHSTAQHSTAQHKLNVSCKQKIVNFSKNLTAFISLSYQYGGLND
ncbi:hypothetical protein MY706_04865 [Haemophilus influenzae]|nr:hypothetical protein [Haemophilus influenzae]